MIPEIGQLILILALAVALVQGVLPMLGAQRGRADWMALARPAAYLQFGLVALSFACLTASFVRHDFSVLYVASNSNSALPLPYRIAAVWGGHEGSLLLWVLMLGVWTVAVARFSRSLPTVFVARILAVLGLVSAGFLLFMLVTSNPFDRLIPAAAEGRDLNPLLQDPGMVIHPPMLYMGYVGFSVAYAFAIAALLGGNLDATWARWTRPWTAAAWIFLTFGIGLGSWWAYNELGWGGWWFWDPVENASFMPWLIATALLHSAIVTEKRGALAGWSLFLALAAFSFSMLGAFLVRSGVLTSVHAFAVDPKRGVLLLIILGLTTGLGFALFAWRAPKLAPGGVFAPISRESALVLNNILLAAATATVLLGTLFPLIREAMTGEAISVGPPYFNLTFVPLMAALAILLPAGPLLAWKRGDAQGVLQRLWAAALAAGVFGVAVYALVSPQKALGAGGLTVGAWLVCGAVAELIERTRAFRVPAADSLRRLLGLPRGAWGMTFAHLGLGVFVLGACMELGWHGEAAETLPIGGSLNVAGYHLVLETVGPVDGPNYDAERAVIRATRDGRPVCTGEPNRRFYPAGGETVSGIAICYRGFSHLYMVLGERRSAVNHPGAPPVWLVRAYWNPWATLIFLGPVIMALGGVISLSDRRLRLGVAPRKENGRKEQPA